MNELRRDPLTGQWVIISEERSGRPQDFLVKRSVRPSRQCPFCEGHEEETPSEVFSTRSEHSPHNTPGWQIRVVPNKYPALLPTFDHEDEGAFLLPQPGCTAEDLYGATAGSGIHEVIIESPKHLVRSTDLNAKQLSNVLRMYRNRLQNIRKNKHIRSGIIFKNAGPEAGATMEHIHSQLIGLPIVAPLLTAELDAITKYRGKYDRCLLCDLISAEKQTAKRVITTTDRYIAFCPYASRQPYETWILPHVHQGDFDSVSDESCDELANILLCTLQSVDALLNKPAYNYMILTAPFDTASISHYHWRIVIIPRTTIQAGFEFGTLCGINPIAPERAAHDLRNYQQSVSTTDDDCELVD